MQPKQYKADSCQEIEEGLALFVALTLGDPKNITTGRKILLRTKCETPVLASMKAAGLI